MDMARFKEFEKKRTVMMKKRELGSKNAFIGNDLAWEEREIQGRRIARQRENRERQGKRRSWDR